ncbi:MAG: FUSC family protein [Acetobacteraceae bacterium]
MDISAMLRAPFDPHLRYRHARLIHATRIAAGILLALGLTVGFGIPHGEWTAISLLIVIAGLQHHGNIHRRAIERALGTALGALAGLLVILQHRALESTPLTWLLIAGFCGVCAYHAIGRGGYVALLAAVTLIIVAGHGTDSMEDSLWRAVNVFIGIAIALLLSFALPIYATWSWRYQLADALRGCAAVCDAMASDAPDAPETALHTMASVSAVLPQLRSLLPWVAKESRVPLDRIEAIQHRLRILISMFELLVASRAQPPDEAARLRWSGLRPTLLDMANALEFGPFDAIAAGVAADAAAPQRPAERALLAYELGAELQRLQAGFADARGLWHL